MPLTAKSLRVVFFGTPEIAVPTLARLLASRHEVVAVVSQPDRGRGRGRKTKPAPVAACALEAGIPVYRPEKSGGARDPEVLAALRDARPDVGVVVAFGQFLEKKIRELPGCGYLINAHASLLPKYRGAAPIARAILAGERETGITVMRVDREMDAGAMALTKKTPIGADEPCGALTERLGVLAADAIEEALDRIADGTLRWTEQDHAQASFAPKIERDDTRLDFHESAEALVRRVRALAPKPGAATTLDGEPLRVLSARAHEGRADRQPGTVVRPPEGGVRVATGDGWLALREVQRAGGKTMEIEAFLRGRDVPEGTRLGAEPRRETPTDETRSEGDAR